MKDQFISTWWPKCMLSVTMHSGNKFNAVILRINLVTIDYTQRSKWGVCITPRTQEAKPLTFSIIQIQIFHSGQSSVLVQEAATWSNAYFCLAFMGNKFIETSQYKFVRSVLHAHMQCSTILIWQDNLLITIVRHSCITTLKISKLIWIRIENGKGIHVEHT